MEIQEKLKNTENLITKLIRLEVQLALNNAAMRSIIRSAEKTQHNLIETEKEIKNIKSVLQDF